MHVSPELHLPIILRGMWAASICGLNTIRNIKLKLVDGEVKADSKEYKIINSVIKWINSHQWSAVLTVEKAFLVNFVKSKF